MRSLPFALMLALFSTAACSKKRSITLTTPALPNTLLPGMFITGDGSWSFTEKMITRSAEVTQTPGVVKLAITRREYNPSGGSSGGTSTSDMKITGPADPWFVFVESPSRYWSFDGTGNLSYNYSDEGGGVRMGPSFHEGKLMPGDTAVPPELVLRLPAEMQKQLPPVEAPKKRPSI